MNEDVLNKVLEELKKRGKKKARPEEKDRPAPPVREGY